MCYLLNFLLTIITALMLFFAIMVLKADVEIVDRDLLFWTSFCSLAYLVGMSSYLTSKMVK